MFINEKYQNIQKDKGVNIMGKGYNYSQALKGGGNLNLTPDFTAIHNDPDRKIETLMETLQTNFINNQATLKSLHKEWLDMGCSGNFINGDKLISLADESDTHTINLYTEKHSLDAEKPHDFQRQKRYKLNILNSHLKTDIGHPNHPIVEYTKS